jgi:hypothetical protein
LGTVWVFPGIAWGQTPTSDSPSQSSSVSSVAPAADPVPAPDPKAQALERFERGVTLFDDGSLEVALTEFLEARRLYPLRSATANAVVCLDKLGRHDEALEMAEALLREFGSAMTPEARERTQHKVLELRARVGTIEITKAEVGATILIDGKDRGEYPPLGPLRVKAGSHLLRVIMPGFEPFETQTDVAGGGIVVVEALQKALIRSGRLSVVEQSGKTLDVVVDGISVGKTPWQGPLPLGDHVVLLRGEGQWGTLPAPIVITQDQTNSISLAAEQLTARLRIEPSPDNAVIALDGLTLGRGVWEGALRTGNHRIEVTAPDFLPIAQSVQVAKDERKTVKIVLLRNPRSLFAVQKPHFTMDGNLNALFVPSFGGDIGQGFGVGGLAMAHGGYEFSSRFAVGISLGGLVARQTVTQRVTAATPVELGPTPSVQNVLVNDDIFLRGLLAGGWAGLTVGTSLLVQVRLGAGAVFGSVSDRRWSDSVLSGTWSMDGETTERYAIRGVYAAPEIRVGLKISSHLTIGAGLSAFTLFIPKPPVWDMPRTHLIFLRDPSGLPNYGTFGVPKVAPEHILNVFQIAIVPGLGLRYDL